MQLKIKEKSPPQPKTKISTIIPKKKHSTRSKSLGKPLQLTKPKKRAGSLQPKPTLPPTLASIQEAQKIANQPELLSNPCNKIVYSTNGDFRCGGASGHAGPCGKKLTAEHQKQVLEKTKTAQAVAHSIVNECTSTDGILTLKTFGKRFTQKLTPPNVPKVKIGKETQLINSLHEIRDSNISLTQLFKNRQRERKLNPKNVIISNDAILSEINRRTAGSYATVTMWMDTESSYDKVKEDCIICNENEPFFDDENLEHQYTTTEGPTTETCNLLVNRSTRMNPSDINKRQKLVPMAYMINIKDPVGSTIILRFFYTTRVFP